MDGKGVQIIDPLTAQILDNFSKSLPREYLLLGDLQIIVLSLIDAVRASISR